MHAPPRRPIPFLTALSSSPLSPPTRAWVGLSQQQVTIMRRAVLTPYRPPPDPLLTPYWFRLRLPRVSVSLHPCRRTPPPLPAPRGVQEGVRRGSGGGLHQTESDPEGGAAAAACGRLAAAVLRPAAWRARGGNGAHLPGGDPVAEDEGAAGRAPHGHHAGGRDALHRGG
eukprot:5704987-Pyramimonas_sp.AAC.2